MLPKGNHSEDVFPLVVSLLFNSLRIEYVEISPKFTPDELHKNVRISGYYDMNDHNWFQVFLRETYLGCSNCSRTRNVDPVKPLTLKGALGASYPVIINFIAFPPVQSHPKKFFE
ncbi:hypothetical protein AG1IA_08895 [Rhizoctonia solani AG-1 IA]|uniref:Uncharacterized protein n=1 Tax=Thanatephorus cucumeris (strain AG1-IA) TaxID=983506 RepID=L8WL40_THACA|nr:hypothetical protein AG1IA_08895 [Rhizoctonia solani AG-1 IA]